MILIQIKLPAEQRRAVEILIRRNHGGGPLRHGVLSLIEVERRYVGRLSP
jgi:hypothetical protein